MAVRRVVTGHDAEGKAVFVADDAVEPVTLSLMPGSEFVRLWGADAAPRFPDDGSMPPHHTYFPPLGGFRFGFFTVPPDGGAGVPADLDVEAALAEFAERLPGLADYLEPDDPGMHTTPTVDCEVVLSGRVTLELDDGVKMELGPGDTVVQNGTRHRWSNPGREPAVLAVFICGAHHDNVG